MVSRMQYRSDNHAFHLVSLRFPIPMPCEAAASLAYVNRLDNRVTLRGWGRGAAHGVAIGVGGVGCGSTAIA